MSLTGPFPVNPQTMDPEEALELVRETIGEVIDIGTREENADRPTWAMHTLQSLRQVEGFVGEIVQAHRKAFPESEAAE